MTGFISVANCCKMLVWSCICGNIILIRHTCCCIYQCPFSYGVFVYKENVQGVFFIMFLGTSDVAEVLSHSKPLSTRNSTYIILQKGLQVLISCSLSLQKIFLNTQWISCLGILASCVRILELQRMWILYVCVPPQISRSASNMDI